jgi:hypothetical protein
LYGREADLQALRSLSDAHRLVTKPAADADMAGAFSILMGMLSEMGRIDEASAVAGEALPITRRSREWFVEEWLYLFWRRGQVGIAVRLLGMSDAQCARNSVTLQPNEERLVTQARPALQRQLSRQALVPGLGMGAAMSEAEMAKLISAALAQHGDNGIDAKGGF